MGVLIERAIKMIAEITSLTEAQIVLSSVTYNYNDWQSFKDCQSYMAL
jgi:hypothetical protein